MVAVRVATFNANNLFSRWSFQADLPRTATVVPTAEITGPTAGSLEAAAATEAEPVPQPKVVDVTLPDGTALTGVLRTYLGNLVKGKDPKARAWIAQRIKALNADVLCLLEVEDQDALDAFDRDDLQPLGCRSSPSQHVSASTAVSKEHRSTRPVLGQPFLPFGLTLMITPSPPVPGTTRSPAATVCCYAVHGSGGGEPYPSCAFFPR